MIHCTHFDSQMSPKSISEHLFFKIFLGARPPSISMLCMHTITLDLSLNKRAPLLLYAPSLLISLGGPEYMNDFVIVCKQILFCATCPIVVVMKLIVANSL